MNKRELRKLNREQEFKDMDIVNEYVCEEELEENEKKCKEKPLEMDEDCKNFIESVRQIKTATIVEKTWWFYYICFWGGATIVDSVALYAYFVSPEKFVLIATIFLVFFLGAWIFITILFSCWIYRELNKPDIYQMIKYNGKDIYFIFLNKVFIYWDGENTTRFYDKKAHRYGNSTFKKSCGCETLDGIISCNKMKRKERLNKVIYKGESEIYSSDTKIITDKNNVPKKYTVAVGSHAVGQTFKPHQIIGINDLERKIYVPKQLKPWMKRKGIEFPDIPNLVELPDERIWKHIKVKDLYEK